MTSVEDITSLLSKLCRGSNIVFSVKDIGDWTDSAAATLEAKENLIGQESTIFHGMRSSKRRAEFLAGRIAAKRLLCKPPFCMSLQETEIKRAPSGAPTVAGKGNLKLSISHAAAYAVAVAAPFGIGVDLETNETRPVSLVDYFFSDKEKRAISLLLPEHRTRVVNQLWTRKEAAVKVGGWGGSLSFRDIDCSGACTWIFGRQIQLRSHGTDDFVASIAYEKEALNG